MPLPQNWEFMTMPIKFSLILSKLRLVTLIGAFALAPLNSVYASGQFELIEIGSGSTYGNYYPVAMGICHFINASVKANHILCRAKSSGGSIDNINKLRSGEIQFAIAQSDTIVAAKSGSELFIDSSPYADLRVVMPLYPEIYTIIVRRDSTFNTFTDLRGRRVNEGAKSSGQYKVTRDIIKALGWVPTDSALFTNYAPRDQLAALCDTKIDAFIMVVGHPVPMLEKNAVPCAVRWIGLDSDSIQKISEQFPYFSGVKIEENIYHFDSPKQSSIGLLSYLVSDQAVRPGIVFEVARIVKENFESLQFLVPVLSKIDGESLPLPDAGAMLPLHSGAIQYYER